MRPKTRRWRTNPGAWRPVGVWLLLVAARQTHAQPLAQCQLTTLGAAEPQPSVVSEIVVTPVLDESTLYRRGPVGDWLVPDEVDPTDPTVYAVLNTPDGPVRLAIDLLVGGEPFRAARERWIDDAIAAAAGPEPPRVAEPDNEPADESAARDPSMVFLNRFEGASPALWLAGHLRRSGGVADRYEARWLLAQRAGGPSLMVLEGYSPNRSSAAPLVWALDTDHDGGLSADEVAGAAVRLASMDANEDGDVALAEVVSATTARAFQVWRAEPLVEPVASPHEAEIRLEVDFAAAADGGGLRLMGAIGDHATGVAQGQRAVSLAQPFGEIELNAATRIGLPDGQVSIGAVVEGSPLWSRIDSDGDNTLSQRERGRVVSALSALDRDADGALSAGEVPTRIRLAATLGAEAHAYLANATRPTPREDPAAAAPAPDWFASMDANGDGDLSPGEFLGGADQFAALDADRDGLVSVAEAIAFK